jgi:phosphoglycolate phosphatase
MIKAFIFDLDGTLADTIYDIGDAVNHILAKRGLPPCSYKDYRAYVGEGISKALERAMGGYKEMPPEEQAAVRKEFGAYYSEHCLEKTKPYDGIPTVLAELQKRGMFMGISTNKPDAPAQKIAACLFADPLFSFVHGAVEGLPLKPDAKRVLDELAKAGIKGEETVYVGDGIVDIETAKNGGFTSCGVLWGFKGITEIKTADYVISKPEELLTIR